MELEGTVDRLVVNSHDSSTVVYMSSTRTTTPRVLLTTRSTCRGEIFQVRGLAQSSKGKCPNFWRYRNFLTTHWGACRRKPPYQKPARFVESFRYNIALWWTLESQKTRRKLAAYKVFLYVSHNYARGLENNKLCYRRRTARRDVSDNRANCCTTV